MDDKIFTILDVCGQDPFFIKLLVHIRDAEAPDDWESYNTRIYTKKGPTFQLEYSADEWVSSMWQSASGQTYAASMDGRIHSDATGIWEMTEIGKKFMFNYIWGIGDKPIYCCGTDGVIFCMTNDVWALMETNLDDDLLVVGGSAPDDLYILSEDGKVFYFNGLKWSEIDSPTNHQLHAVLSLAKDDVYICGEEGIFLHGSLNGWDLVQGADFNLYSLAKYGSYVLSGAGDRGIFKVSDSSLVPFVENIEADGLQVIGNSLFAFAKATLYEFDGKNWIKNELEFEKI
jgi:hypothetical protein